MSLRSKVIRLAHAKPELREKLLPILKEAAVLSRTQEIELKGILEDGGSNFTRPIAARTFKALEARGMVTGGDEVSMLNTGRYGLVSATLTPKGKELAIELFRQEHEQRLREGLKSERIPKLLRAKGIEI